jgi:2-polyprenyl-6-methoxyphenol hydroxylase-like FAD-dependent oxidoreductase
MSAAAATRTQVLVVGAGPVGLIAALRLREQGLAVRIIERQPEHAAHTFPVVLHPGSLRILSSLSLTAALFWRGRPVSRLAIYTEGERRAVLDLPRVPGISTGALTLPQDILRKALVNALSTRGVDVEWQSELVHLEQDERGVHCRLLTERNGSADVAPASQQVVDADFVIGADGYDSAVRKALGLELVAHGSLQSYVFFDAASQRAGNEAQLSLLEDSSNAVYPIQGDLARFSFQLTSALHRPPDLAGLRELIASRLPFYGDQVSGLEWAGIAEFRRALVQRFGVGRVWLAGEAAHLTGPLGTHSLNIGIDEAAELALRRGDCLRHPTRAEFGQDYEAKRTREWRLILGLDAPPSLGPRSAGWALQYLDQLLPCLPASGADLDDLLDQLRLTPSSRPRKMPAQPSG